MKPSASRKMIVPAYWPAVEGVQEVENSGSVVVAWKVIAPIEWADEEDISSMADEEGLVGWFLVKSDIVASCSSLSLCRGRRKWRLGIS